MRRLESVRFSNLSLATVAIMMLAHAPLATAEPLVTIEGGKAKPGVVTAWAADGKKVTLTVKQGTDATAVAKAISDETGTKAKVTGDKILVIGKTEQELLSAMAEIDFGVELAALAEASLKGDDFDSGSSLRAKKTADMEKLMKDLGKSVSGKIVSVRFGKFPETEVEVRVLRAPTGELGKSIRKGGVVKLRPVLKKKGTEIDWSDEHTQQNAGAWYLEKGDSVEARIGPDTNGVFSAELLTR